MSKNKTKNKTNKKQTAAPSFAPDAHFSWKCAFCSTPVLPKIYSSKDDEGMVTYFALPISKYWLYDCSQVFCSAEHSLLYHEEGTKRSNS